MNDVIGAAQQAVTAAVAIGGVLFAFWLLIGKEVWKEVRGHFERIDQMEKAQTKGFDKLNSGQDAMSADIVTLTKNVDKLTDGYHNLRERTARLEGREEGRAEVVQAANAAANVAAALKPPEDLRHE